MPIGPATYFGKEREFVDREDCIQVFKENIHKSGTQNYNILFFYGIPGIGKSKLQKKLQQILNEEYPKIFWVSIDFDVRTYRDIGTFLITLRNKIQEKCDAKFYLFNAVHAIYWRKFYPDIPLQKQNYPLIKEGGFLEKTINILDSSGKTALAWEVLNKSSETFRNWCNLHHINISKIDSLEPNKIEELLPGIFAANFSEYLNESSRVYIFIDTYESLWKNEIQGSFHEKDAWIRDNLIQNMSGVSWVICGREKLRWALECDSDWDMYLKQYPVEDLSENYSDEFLKKCDIENKDIRNVIIKASEGVPYYLNLSVDTYEKISRNKQPVPENFGETKEEVFSTFVKYLNPDEIRALKVLSVSNFWDKDLFEILMRKYDTGFPISAFSELIKYSFIKTVTDGRFFIHKLMRKSLQEHQDPVDRENVHKFLLEHYSHKLKNIDIKTITPEHETALTEAFYHARNSLEVNKLLNFFNRLSDPFFKAAFWRLIIPMHEDLLQTLEVEFGKESIVVAATLNILGGLYQDVGNFEKAMSIYQRALQTINEVEDPNKWIIKASILNNFGQFYQAKGDYEKSLDLYEKALSITKKGYGEDNPHIATILNNLAGIRQEQRKLKEALSLYQQALNIRKKFFGSKHPEVANVLNNIACLHEVERNYEEALKNYLLALNIREKAFGPEHPIVASTLRNIAGIYVNIGRYKEAKSLLQRSLEIYKKRNESKTPNFAVALSTLGSLCRYFGEYEEGILLCQQALSIQENTLESTNYNIVCTLNSLAGLYTYVGKFEEAFQLYLRSLQIEESTYGKESLEFAGTLNNLSELYSIIKEYEKGIPICERALEIRRSILGREHQDIATTLNNLGVLYSGKGDYEKALSLYKESLAIYENMRLGEHPQIVTTLNNIAEIYEIEQEYDKSIQCYKRALHIARDNFGTNHIYFKLTKNSLYTLLNKLS